MARGSSMFLGGDEVTYPESAAYAKVFIKKNWSDSWAYTPQLFFDAGSATIASRGIGSATLWRRYGNKKEVYETDYSSQGPKNLMKYWIMVELASETSSAFPIWVGRIYDKSRQMLGSDEEQSGIQYWTAYEPMQELRMKYYYNSYWLEGGAKTTIGWVPDFNKRDENNTLVGNMAGRIGTPVVSNVFGDIGVWNRYKMIEYILVNHADESEDDGPIWDFGGQTELLENIEDTIAGSGNVADDLVRLIPEELGMDFDILWKYDEFGAMIGFTVWIFTRTDRDITVGDYTLPKNPSDIYIKIGDSKEITEVLFEETEETKYNQVRITGERIITCMTLYGRLDFGETQRDSWELEKKWTDEKEAEFLNPGKTGALLNDRQREREIYNVVFKLHGAKDDWGYAGPVLDKEGNVVGTGATYQRMVRETLDRLILREGYDYTTNPATNNNKVNYMADFLKPAVYLWDPDQSIYVAADKADINVSRLEHEHGVKLHVKNQQLIGKNHWSGADASYTKPKFDYEQIIITIAFPTDHKLAIHEQLDADGEKELVIEFPGAELWYLPAETVVGIDADGYPQTSGPKGRVLRNDATRMLPMLAGAKANYHFSRQRGVLTMKGWRPWREALGYMASVYEDEGDTKQLKTIVSSVEWTADGMTIITIGNA